MTVKEFKRDVRKASAVMAWVRLFDGDGAYVKLQKKSVLATVASSDDDKKIDAHIMNDTIYID